MYRNLINEFMELVTEYAEMVVTLSITERVSDIMYLTDHIAFDIVKSEALMTLWGYVF